MMFGLLNACNNYEALESFVHMLHGSLRTIFNSLSIHVSCNKILITRRTREDDYYFVVITN